MANSSNWAGNITYTAPTIFHPETAEQVQELVARARSVKALGTRHAFNTIADSPDAQLSLQHLDDIVALDRTRNTVTVEAGIRYGTLCQTLHREGYALHNLASLPHISVAGACATATHGSGDGNANLAAAVTALEMVIANGDVVTLTRERDGDTFQGAVVGLGALGVVTKLTLDLLPTFTIRQDLYENLPLAQLETHFDAITSSAYSVSLFTDWRGDAINQVWRKSRVEEGAAFTPEPVWFGATLATRSLHPIASMSAENCTAQMGQPGPWQERLPHFRMEFTPSAGEELQAEYLVPRAHALAALRAVSGLREQIAPLLLISEIRTVADDDLWLSPCYQTPCVGIHFTWKQEWPAVSALLPRIEAALAPFQARPHWGKLFTMFPVPLQSLYPKLPDFQRLMHSYDPDGKFHNAFLETYLVNPS